MAASDDGAFFTPMSLIKMIVDLVESTVGMQSESICVKIRQVLPAVCGGNKIGKGGSKLLPCENCSHFHPMFV